MACEMPENFLPNAHTLQTQFDCLAQHRLRLAPPYAEAHHGDSGDQQHGLRRRLFSVAHVSSPFLFSATIIAQER